MLIRVGFGLVLVGEKVDCLVVSKVTINQLFASIGIKPKPLRGGQVVVYRPKPNGSMQPVVVVAIGSIHGVMKKRLVSVQ